VCSAHRTGEKQAGFAINELELGWNDIDDGKIALLSASENRQRLLFAMRTTLTWRHQHAASNVE
jgi:hypothetical protein